jgi:hypothetical protein
LKYSIRQPINERLTKQIFSDKDLEVNASKESDIQADLDRELTSETNHHSARDSSIVSHYAILKDIGSEGEWSGLYIVKDRKGNKLPRELDQRFTTVDFAINSVKAYINSQKQKEIENV